MAWEVPKKVEKTSGDIAIGVLVRCFFDFLLPLPCQTLVFGPISDKCLSGPGSASEAPGVALGGSSGVLEGVLSVETQDMCLVESQDICLVETQDMCCVES